MTDDDLIRRGDVKAIVPPLWQHSLFPAIAAIPAVTAPVAVMEVQPTEYQRKVAQMKEDFPNGI